MIKLTDIAKELKLSRITVSAVLNDRYKRLGITDATAQRVLEKANEMGYRRNQLAMAIKTGRSFTFGIMLGTDRIEDWLGHSIKGAFEVVQESNYNIKLEFLQNGCDETRGLNALLGQRVEGILGIDLHPNPEILTKIREAIAQYSVPFVCSNSAPGLSETCLEPDNTEGMRLALEHLIGLGHRRIAYIGGGDVTEAGIRRNEAFKNLSSELGLSIPDEHIRLSLWDLNKAEECARDMLSGANPPSALIGANDRIAVVAIRCARKMGIQVPRDLSVIGFSNELLSELSDPPLTVIDMHHENIGRRALEMLVDHAEGPDRTAPLSKGREITPVSLMARQSTAKPAP